MERKRMKLNHKTGKCGLFRGKKDFSVRVKDMSDDPYAQYIPLQPF